jgi:hypothetical protein
LFFLPRRPAGSLPEAFKTLVVEGKPLNLDDVPKITEAATANASNTDDPPDKDVVESALRFLVGLGDRERFDIEDYDTWRDTGIALKPYGGSGQALWDLAAVGFDRELAEWHRHEAEHNSIWDGLKREKGIVTTVATILHKAREKGWQQPRKSSQTSLKT